MIRVSSYLKMRVLGAVESAAGKTIRERIQKTADLIFNDEEGKPRQFTWRTIQTWYTRFKTHGVTGVVSKDRSDKGKTRKLAPEELLEVLNQVRPHLRNQKNITASISTAWPSARACFKNINWPRPLFTVFSANTSS